MSELAKILGLLKSDSIEKQIAAAIVIAELHPKGAEVAAALAGALESDVTILQRLAERLQRVTLELRQFIHKEYAQMGQ